MKNSIFNAVCKTRYLALLVVLILTCGNAWGADSQLYFEGWESHHRTSGTNNYGATPKTYGDFTFVYADAVSSGSPLTGSYHAILRNASKTNYTCSLTSGALLSSSYEIHMIKWNCKGNTSQNLKVYYSTDGSTWTKGYDNNLPSTKTERSITSLSITGPIYLKFEVSLNNTTNSNRDGNIDDIALWGEEVSSCEKIDAPSVTATPGNARIDLSWANQTGASSYTVTCTPSEGTVGTPSKSGSTWSCAITGLTNGTSYTWTVTPVGDGTDYCSSGNTAASGSATPNVYRTITYYDKDGSHTTSLADGTNIATALTALYGGSDPVSCDATNYEYFVGWRVGEISGSTTSDPLLLTTQTVNSSSPSNNYYAVWSDTDPDAGGWTAVTSIAVGDVVVFAYDDSYYEMTGVASNLGTATLRNPYAIAGTYPLTVEAGNGGTGYSFKNGNNYLSYSGSSNNLYTSTTKDNNSSWTISTSSGGNFKFANVGTTSRILQFNSGSPRWACYGNSNQSAFQIYKQGSAGTPEYITTCGSTYTITLAGSPAGTVTGGTFTASAASASQGTVIKLTANPSRGYEFGSWTVTDASSNPVSVSNNQFTMPASNVTVSATFNTATPLTITLSTNSKGTFTNPNPWPIYSGETFTFPDVTPNDPTCATFVGWIQGTTFPGDGSTHDEPTGLITAGTESTAQTTDATYTAVFYETETTESDAYVKVTSAPANWANDHYLIVYEGDATHAAVAFDGKRDNGDNGNIDAASNGVEVTITNDAIAKTARLAAAEWRIAAVTGGHSIQSASGFYIGQTTDANGLLNNSSTAYVNTLAYSSGFSVTGSGNAVLRYNNASDQLRFRYYKSSSYSSQQVIQLYKLGTAEVQTRTYTTNPSCTPKYRVTVASVTGGSPNADPRYNPETTEVSLTANPSAGYAFTSWKITKTTGGDNVTTTLLPGAKATTANTTFSMPAYNVTVTAAYSKKTVSELKVMDGSTVVANTTGSVSGTLNVSTGANKTLDVVITPSDAFDHSWTATVTSGGTYASISNVTSDGFRVNGLSQGDATVTVTAPNDGSAKVVTFTVHVTDVLPTEIILKRDGSETPINALTIYLDQYAKINVSYSPTPTDKAFTFSSADATSVSSHAHASTSGYETLHGLKVTSSPVNCTFTSAATSSVTKVLAVTVLPCPADRFVDYIHGNATVTRAAQVSADHWSINTSITTPTLSDAAESASADCEAGHYHLIGWLPQSIAEALFAAGTPITSATEGLVAAGAEIEASGITWYAIWAKKE